MVEDPPIRAERQAIGDVQTAHHRRAPAGRIEAVEAAGGRAWLGRIAHAADKEAPLAVAATVIQAVVGQIRLRGRERRQLAAVEVEAIEAGLEGEERLAFGFAQREGADRLQQRPDAVAAG